ncbi:MAG: hypothetical protein H6581_16115 [Bacteroidia bacterium]|nr:hypothetical protein [Bacteroidia bacterium]
MSVRRDTIRVSSSLREFYGIAVLHDYYKSVVCKDLSFEPTPRTKLLLKNFNLLFRPLNYGFVLLYNPAESPSLFQKAMPKTRLSFFVSNRNLKFQNFTQIPFLKEGMSYHFSNLAENSVDLGVDNIPEVFYTFKNLNLGENEKKLLHFRDHSQIPVRPTKFLLNAYQIPGLDDDTRFKYIDLEIQDEWGETTFGDGRRYLRTSSILRAKEINYAVRKELDKHLNLSAEEKGKLAEEIRKREVDVWDNYDAREQLIDLSHAPEGKYKLFFQGKEILEFYSVEGASPVNFGLLDIHLDSPTGLVNRLEKDPDKVVNPQMQYVHFQSRPTYWRYHFLNYPDSIAKPLSILDERKRVDFGDPTEIQLQQTGEPAIMIESKHQIKLEEKPDNYFFLQRRSGNRTLKEIRLPSPSPDMVKPIKDNDELKIYSDIFVYL